MLFSHRPFTRREFLKSAASLGAFLAISPNWNVLPGSVESDWLHSNLSVLPFSGETTKLYSNNLNTRYNQIRCLTAHNAFSNPNRGYSTSDPIFTNQRISITSQLTFGVRALMLDVYWQNDPQKPYYNQVVCAHSNLIIRPEYDIRFQSILDEITTWMQKPENKNEVVTLFFEDYVDGHHNILAQQLRSTKLWFDNAQCESAAIEGWPTLGDMCHNNQRLVAFVEKTPLQKQKESFDDPKKLIPHTYDYVVETTYGEDSTNIDNWSNNRSSSAPLDGPAKFQKTDTKTRIIKRISTENSLALVNHFKTFPNWQSSDYKGKINHISFLQKHIDYYIWNNHRVPNFLALDFVDVGGSKEALDYLGTKQPMFGYSWTPFIGEMHPKTIDWSTEYFISIPAPWFLAGIDVIDEGGYGITNMMTYGSTDYHKQDLAIFPAFGRAHDDPHIGWVNNEFSGKKRSFMCPQGTYIDAIQVAKHHQWGIVNLRCHMQGRGWANWITNNEKENAEAISVPHIVNRIGGFHIQYQGGHGLVDMRYCWAGGQDTLATGDKLEVARMLHSPNSWYSLEMQTDGNLVLYRSPDRLALWSTNTNKKKATQVIMQDDGNLVLYTADMKPLWASNTNASENRGAVLRLQNDGNLVIYKGTKAIWSSKTVDG
jgi:hypothetical protein